MCQVRFCKLSGKDLGGAEHHEARLWLSCHDNHLILAKRFVIKGMFWQIANASLKNILVGLQQIKIITCLILTAKTRTDSPVVLG